MLLPVFVLFLVFGVDGIDLLLPEAQLIVEDTAFVFPFFMPFSDELAFFRPGLMQLLEVAVILLLAFH